MKKTEKTNLQFSTIKTNNDDKNNNFVKNNFIDTNNYAKQNLYELKDKNENFNNDKNEDNYGYLTNQRSKSIVSGSENLDAYTRRKIMPISHSNGNYKITRVNVDSTYREKYPKNMLDSVQHNLTPNPFYFQINSNLLTIYDQNHGYSYGDNIVLQNLRISPINCRIDFETNSSFVKIEYLNHNLNPNNTYLVLLQNFIGNQNNNTLFDNISVNYINKIQTVLFTNGTDVADNDYFYININILAKNNNNSTVNASLYSLNGIQLNYINSNYPININQLQSSLTIVNIISSDFYQVALESSATIGLTDNSNLSVLQNSNGIGGSDIIISKIVDVIEGFPNSNTFKYNLGRTFKKVNKIRLISTEIPNTQKMIRSSPAIKKNNILYWQNIDDGEYIYNVEITPGNYTIDTLSTEITKNINTIPRINQNNVNTATIIYLNDHFVNVTIDQSTNVFSISFFTTIILSGSITKSTYTFTDGFNRIIVDHPNHKLNAGDSVVINNAIDTESIPASALNGTFNIEAIIDADHYQIKLNKYNTSSTTAVTGGGQAITLLKPLLSRLLFNYPNTVGTLLGFRNVGEYNAITIYSKVIKNTSPYDLDLNLNSIGIKQTDNISNTLLNFNGENYIFLTINYIFKDSIDTNGIENIFAKLLLSGNLDYVIYNDFIQIGEEFLEPIISLSEIEFSFYTVDANLFDFNNINVSFTIEIFEQQC
jgi:hypothetical protein